MLKNLIVGSALILSLGLVSKSTPADSVAIQNASFETTSGLTSPCAGPGTCLYNGGPIPGWTMTGSGGSFEPSSAYFTFPPPDGNVIAYSNGGTISQDLGVGALANESYTLSTFVGDRLDSENTTYSIALLAGSTTLCSFSQPNAEIGAGFFALETCTFSGSPTVPLGDLSIVLTSNGAQGDFDNVSLTDDAAVSTPEPGSLILSGCGLAILAGLVAFSDRKRFLLARSN